MADRVGEEDPLFIFIEIERTLYTANQRTYQAPANTGAFSFEVSHTKSSAGAHEVSRQR
jgi:hypothetical protein